MIIHRKCKVCDKLAVTKSEHKYGGVTTRTYTCGHTEVTYLKRSEYDVVSEDNKTLYNFQLKGAEFIESSGARCLIADEMGLGKTIQALAFLKHHPECCPFLVIPKSGLKIQWMREIMRWCGEDFFPQIIDSSRDKLFKGPMCYIVSMDMLRRFTKDDNGHSPLKSLGIKTIIIDEVQNIKNPDSKRTGEVRHLCRDVEHIIGLSGTPIKNHTGEYFPILNILRPDKFPRYQTFLWQWVDNYWDGYKSRMGGLKNPSKFKEFTSDFIIRRTRAEVLPDLPTISRDFRFSDLGDEVEDAYKKTVKEFQDYYYGVSGDSEFARQSNILAYLSKMRHLTGIAKINPCVEFVEDFITSTDRKIVIFLHHKDVAETLLIKLRRIQSEQKVIWGESILSLSANLSSEDRQRVVDEFWSNNYRVLIASTLASGEGLNLQCCSDCIMMERQWNPPNEEQAECRFVRIGQVADKVNATYLIAVGTVDEFLSTIVEVKRENIGKTLDGKVVKWDETALIRELADVVASKGSTWKKP